MALNDKIYRPIEKIIVFVVIDTSGNMEGEISDGRPHGYGTGTFADGRVQEGKWEHGKFLG